VRGELRLTPFFEEAVDALVGKTVSLIRESDNRSLTLTMIGLRPGPKSLLAAFDRIDSPEAAADYVNSLIIARKGDLPPLPEGRYYYEEIIGLPAYDEAGRFVGRLADFFEAGEKDVWTFVDDAGVETMTPCLPETVLNVDLEAERILLRPMEVIE
jgi:16S rRNA processing protein RimM